MLNVMVVDDEPLARARLASMLAVYQEYKVVAQAGNGVACIEALQQMQVDIVLLDIRMPGMDGIETAAFIAKLDNPPAVIFCTAYQEYAVKAFEVQAVGYLLKPVREQSLIEALQKAAKLNRAQIESLREGEQADETVTPSRTHISAKTHQGLQLVAIDQVLYCRADQKYVTVKHQDGELLIDETLKELETTFSHVLVRIHRNTLVNLHAVSGFEKADNQTLLCLKTCEDKLPISRRHLAQVRKLLSNL